MRVGTGTVLGIGVGAAASTGSVTIAPVPKVGVDADSPETRSFESFKPELAATEFSAVEEAVPAAAVTPPSIEPPTNRPPPPNELTPEPTVPLQRIPTEFGIVPPETNVEGAKAKPPVPRRTEHKSVEQVPTGEDRLAGERSPAAEAPSTSEKSLAAEKIVAKVKLTTKAIAVPVEAGPAVAAVSDPPTARWTGQAIPTAEPKASDSQQRTKPSEPALPVSPNNPSLPATTRSVELSATDKSPASTRLEELPLSDSRKREVGEHEVEANQTSELRADRSTTAPMRPRNKSGVVASAANSAAKHGAASKTLASGSLPPKPVFTTGRVSVAVLLIGLGLFAGMKIVGSRLGPVILPESPTSATRAPLPSAPATAWDTTVIELLRMGDVNAAEQVLATVPAGDQTQSNYRNLQVQVSALAADLNWWKVQLVGKAAGEVYVQAKQQLTERLEHVKTHLVAAGPEGQWPEPVIAAALDARRMRGEKSEPSDPIMLERLKRPSTAELKYTQLLMTWVRTGTPNDETIDGLRRLRATPLDLGPCSVALIVALAQLNKFDDAKPELDGLASQSRPHPLLNEMRAYVLKAQQAYVDSLSSAKLDAGTPERAESGDNDPDLLEGDFRLRLTRASECLARNELTKAQKLLRSVLAQRPNDTEAIAALADVMRRRGDLTQARTLYDKVLAINANYLPAMSGAADLRWRSGDRAGAASLYRRIIERVGETPGYGQVAAARLREVDAPSKSEPKSESRSDGQAAGDSAATRDKKPATSAPKAAP